MEVKIRAIYDEHKGRYGYRRITVALCSSMAQPVNHKCVQRLMQKMGLRVLNSNYPGHWLAPST